jgi:hypothetical protein
MPMSEEGRQRCREAGMKSSRKGIPNKITQDVAKALDKLGCNPLELSAKIALGEELDGPHPALKQFSALVDRLDKALAAEKIDEARNMAEELRALIERELTQGYVPIELRSKHIVDLTQYILPKRKAVEHSGPGGGPVEHNLNAKELPTDALRAILASKLKETDGSKP